MARIRDRSALELGDLRAVERDACHQALLPDDETDDRLLQRRRIDRAAGTGVDQRDGAIRTDLDAGFDFAYDIQGAPETGLKVVLPRAALGITSGGTAEPGVMRREEAFDDLETAPSNGYVTEEAVPVALGEVYIVRSRVVCDIGVPVYAKIEIIGFEDNSLVLKRLKNVNCGYRELEPGLPDR